MNYTSSSDTKYLISGNSQANIDLLAEYDPLGGQPSLCTKEVRGLTPSGEEAPWWWREGGYKVGLFTFCALTLWNTNPLSRLAFWNAKQPTTSGLNTLSMVSHVCMGVLISLIVQTVATSRYFDKTKGQRFAILDGEYLAVGKDLVNGARAQDTTSLSALKQKAAKIRRLVETGVLRNGLLLEAKLTEPQAEAITAKLLWACDASLALIKRSEKARTT